MGVKYCLVKTARPTTNNPLGYIWYSAYRESFLSLYLWDTLEEAQGFATRRIGEQYSPARITKEVCKVLRSGIAHPRGILIDGRVL